MLLKNRFDKKILYKYLILYIFLIPFQGCKIYNDPISFEQAVNNKEGEIVKITMDNGNEFIYEDIEIINGLYYGIQVNNGEKVKIALDKNEIKDIQIRNKNSSKGSNILGIGIGGLALISGLLMIQ